MTPLILTLWNAVNLFQYLTCACPKEDLFINAITIPKVEKKRWRKYKIFQNVLTSSLENNLWNLARPDLPENTRMMLVQKYYCNTKSQCDNINMKLTNFSKVSHSWPKLCKFYLCVMLWLNILKEVIYKQFSSWSSGRFNQQQSQWRIDTIILFTTMQSVILLIFWLHPCLKRRQWSLAYEKLRHTHTQILFRKKSHPIRN